MSSFQDKVGVNKSYAQALKNACSSGIEVGSFVGFSYANVYQTGVVRSIGGNQMVKIEQCGTRERRNISLGMCQKIEFMELHNADIPHESVVAFATDDCVPINTGVVRWIGKLQQGQHAYLVAALQTNIWNPDRAIFGLPGFPNMQNAFAMQFPHLDGTQLVLLGKIYLHEPHLCNKQNIEESSRVETRKDGTVYYGSVKGIWTCVETKKAFASLDVDEVLPDYTGRQAVTAKYNNMLFCPLDQCELDKRFQENISSSISATDSGAAASSCARAHDDKQKLPLLEDIVYDHPSGHHIQVNSMVLYNQWTAGVVKLIFRDRTSQMPHVYMVALELDNVIPPCSHGVYRELQLVPAARKNILFCPLDQCELDKRFLDTTSDASIAGVSKSSTTPAATSQTVRSDYGIKSGSLVRFWYSSSYGTGVVTSIRNNKDAVIQEYGTSKQRTVLLSACRKLDITELSNAQIPLGSVAEYTTGYSQPEVKCGFVRWIGQLQEAEGNRFTVVAVETDTNDPEDVVGLQHYPHLRVAFMKSFPYLEGTELVLSSLLRRIYLHEPRVCNEQDIEEGTLVETRIHDVVHYGVVKWIGKTATTEEKIAMLEMDKVPSHLRSGYTPKRPQVEAAARKNIHFCALNQCKPDRRVLDTINHRITEEKIPLEHREEKQHQNPSTDLQTQHGACGLWKGIQGDINSCYMDSALFSMFAFCTAFDSSIRERFPETKGLIRIIREHVIYPLRKHGHVASESMHQFRKELDGLGKMKGITDREKDPEEFINVLLNDVFKTEPLIELSTNEACNTLGLVGVKDETTPFPTVQMLLEWFCLLEKIKFKKTPKCLILHMPRFGKHYKMYERIFPDLTIDLTDLTEDSQRKCHVCGTEAVAVECPECFDERKEIRKITFCNACFETFHKHAHRKDHLKREIAASAQRVQTDPKLELSAVLCIETSHYVSFCKTSSGDEAPWVFFDSMSRREDGVNVPEVTVVPEAPYWLSRQGYEELRNGNNPSPLNRLFKDIYICIYCKRLRE